MMGAGRLTDKCMNTLQNYFGMAIRQNKGNILDMRNGIIAVLHHCTAFSSDEHRHIFCPKNDSSWCKWQVDKLKGTSSFKSKMNLPLAIFEEVKPIFQDLSKKELLTKCLHGQTQNTNEAFNLLIWDRCPKTTFVSKKIVEIAVGSAVINYNSGMLGLEDVYNKLGFFAGSQFYVGASKKDNNRIALARKKSQNDTKKRRKTLRAVKKGYIDLDREKEGGKSYEAGGFSSK